MSLLDASFTQGSSEPSSSRPVGHLHHPQVSLSSDDDLIDIRYIIISYELLFEFYCDHF